MCHEMALSTKGHPVNLARLVLPPCLLLHVVEAILMYDLRQSPCAGTATCQLDWH